jgi:hypothetical protein
MTVSPLDKAVLTATITILDESGGMTPRFGRRWGFALG